MKKYIIGGLVGFILATAASVNAEGVTKLIDQVVQGVFPVTVEGNSVGDAIVVDNKTYLPVREFGEAVGYKVTFTEEREVVLTKNSETTPIVTPSPTPVPTSDKTVAEQITELNRKIDEINVGISKMKEFKQWNESLLDKPNSPPKEEVKKAIAGYNISISELEAELSNYESQLAALQSQK